MHDEFENIDNSEPRGYHSHECRNCGCYWEHDSDECQLREDTLCNKCYELVYPNNMKNLEVKRIKSTLFNLFNKLKTKNKSDKEK